MGSFDTQNLHLLIRMNLEPQEVIVAEKVEDITITYEEDGKEVVREIDKQILTKGAWATIIFKFDQWEAPKEAYSKPKFTIRRYRKMNGEYKQQSKFNISSEDQATKIIEALTHWLGEDAAKE